MQRYNALISRNIYNWGSEDRIVVDSHYRKIKRGKVLRSQHTVYKITGCHCVS